MDERQSPPSADGPSAGNGSGPTANAAKIALRDQLLTARHRRGLLEVGAAGSSGPWDYALSLGHEQSRRRPLVEQSLHVLDPI